MRRWSHSARRDICSFFLGLGGEWMHTCTLLFEGIGLERGSVHRICTLPCVVCIAGVSDVPTIHDGCNNSVLVGNSNDDVPSYIMHCAMIHTCLPRIESGLESPLLFTVGQDLH